jgi:hypothetical protein
MYLRDLAMYASKTVQMPTGWTHREFNQSTHTPVEAYLDSLPRRRVVLGDLSKVNVVVGPRPPGAPAYFAALNVAIIYRPRFDFGRYFLLSRGAQQRRVIEVLHRALLRIARRTGCETSWYEGAFAALRRTPFPMPELTDFELRRRWGLLQSHEKRALLRGARQGERSRSRRVE